MKACWRWVRKADYAARFWLWRHQRVLTPAWAALVIVIVILIVIELTILFRPAPWDWMKEGDKESNGSVLRNLALVAAAVIGLPLAVWRSWLAHKQANTAERGHNNERYQKGADMLGSDVVTTRMGGVFALGRLAQERPHEYHVQIMRLLCAFLRHRAKDGGEEAEAENKELRLDLNAAAQAIGECRRRSAKTRHLKYIENDFSLDFRDMNLSGADFHQAKGLLQKQLNTACQHPDGRSPRNLPDGLTGNEKLAIDRWREFHEPQDHG